MPGVLITRSLAPAQLLAQRLRESGYTPVIEPLLTILPTGSTAPDLSRIDAVMLTSASALAFLPPDGAGLARLLSLPCYCVGLNTEAAAASFGFSDRRTGAHPGNGAELAQFILSDTNGQPQRLLHIAGQQTDPAGRETLEAAGYSVTLWVIYAAQQVTAFSVDTIAGLRAGRIEAALIFSRRTAQSLIGCIDAAGLRTCCASLTAIGLSEAVASPLRALSWRQIGVAARPDEDAMIETLKMCLPVCSAG